MLSTVQKILPLIGQAVSADRVFLTLFSEDRKFIEQRFEWLKKNNLARIIKSKPLPMKYFKWAFGLGKTSDYIRIADFQKLPQVSKWQNKTVRSLVIFPLKSQGELIGSFGISSRTPDYPWSESTLFFLRLVGQLLGQALTKKDLTKKLLQHQEQFQLLFNSMPDGAILSEVIRSKSGKAKDLRFLDANDVFYKTTDLNLKRLQNITLKEFFKERDSDWVNMLLQVAETGKATHFERYFSRIQRWLRGVLFCPRPGQCLIILNDFTDQKKIIENSRINEERMNLVTSQLPLILWTTDMNFHFQSAHGLGFKDRPIRGERINQQTIYEYFKTRSRKFPAIAAHLAARKGKQTQYLLENQGFYYNCIIRPLRDTSGKIIGTIGIATDITPQTRQDQELKLMQFSIDHAADGIYRIDMKGNIVYANDSACQLLGYKPSALLKKEVFDITPLLNRNNWGNLCALLKKHKKYRLETEQRTSTGSFVPVEISMYYFEFQKKEFICGFLRDISNRKKAAALQRKYSDWVFEGQESERRRISQDLHDGVIQLLASAHFRSKMAENLYLQNNPSALNEIRKTQAMLGSAVEDVRRLSRQLRPRILDDLGLFPALHSICKEWSDRTGIPIQYMPPDNNPDVHPVTAQTLFRITQEALNNIEKHAKATRVAVSLQAERSGWLLMIRDNGHGMSKQNQHKPFSGQLGLGLLHIHERVNALGGHIHLDSRPNRGTEIQVNIPFTLKL